MPESNGRPFGNKNLFCSKGDIHKSPTPQVYCCNGQGSQVGILSCFKVIIILMKRSNFLASIAAIFLAPFGIKAKPEYTRFTAVSSSIPKYFLEAWITREPGSEQVIRGFRNEGISINLPIVPDDGKPHLASTEYDNGNAKYFIDGKHVDFWSDPIAKTGHDLKNNMPV